MAGNYSNVDGVSVQEWGDGDEPEEEHRNAHLEEMYVDKRGLLYITIDADDGPLYSITVPVVARKSWNSFKDSLPEWRDP